MDNNQEKKSIKDAVLEGIKHGDIKKIPKVFFTAKNALFLIAIIIAFGFSLFLISFIFFTLQMSELWYLPMFGFKGVELLLGNFPWFLILVVVLFVVLLEYFVSRFRFAYRQPLLYSSIFIIITVVVVSIFVRQTPLYQVIYSQTEQGKFKLMKPFYDQYAKPTSVDFHPGTVVDVNQDGFTLEQRDKGVIQVEVSQKTQIPRDFKIYPGGRLLIIGKVINGVIEAENIDNAPASGRP